MSDRAVRAQDAVTGPVGGSAGQTSPLIPERPLFTGRLYEVRTWPRALTAREIAAEYAKPLHKFSSRGSV